MLLRLKRVSLTGFLLLTVFVSQVVSQVSHDFEPESNFLLGDLNGQQGWQVDQGQALISGVEVHTGLQSVELLAHDPFTQIRFNIDRVDNESVTFTDFYIKPRAGALSLQQELLDLEGSLVGVFSSGENLGEVYVYSNGSWTSTGYPVDLDANGLALDWLRVTVRQDLGAAGGPIWDIYLNDRLVDFDLSLAELEPGYPLSFIMMGQVSGHSYFDDFSSGENNPLFTDYDKDGVDDAFELVHGSDSTVNDRDADADADGDGQINIIEYMNAVDTDGDGLSDEWEQQIIDAGIGDLNNDGVVDVNDVLPGDDFDGDGLSNLSEFANGTDPIDYYNEEVPIITILAGYDQSGPSGQFLPEGLLVKVENSSGDLLVNAPVNFAVTFGAGELSETNTASGTSNIEVRTQTNGRSFAYFKPLGAHGDSLEVTSEGGGASQVFVASIDDTLRDIELTANLLGISQTELIAEENDLPVNRLWESVAVSEDLVIMGAPFDNSGSAYVFKQSSGNWEQEAKLSAQSASTIYFFGSAVAIAEDTAVVIAFADKISIPSNPEGFQEAYERALIYFFERDPVTLWAQTAEHTVHQGLFYKTNGVSVSMDGQTVIVGIDDDTANLARLFTQDENGQWVEEASLNLPAGEIVQSNFGVSVAVSGDTAVVGASENEDHNKGAVYMFSRDQNDVWNYELKLSADENVADPDFFGVSLALSENRMIVGASNDQDGEGAAYLFEFGGDGIWTQKVKLTASGGGITPEFFGDQVAFSGDRVVIGSEANESEDPGAIAGLVYVFNHDGNDWVQETQWPIVNDHVTSSTRNHFALALSEEVLVVGASWKEADLATASLYAWLPQVEEGSSAGTPIATIISQPEGVSGLNLLFSDPSGFFELAESSGVWQLQVASGADLDYETKTQYFLSIQADNGREDPFDKEFVIGVANNDDEDGDGLPDAIEQEIIDFDPNDGFETLVDVLPGDDFDQDGVSNFDEAQAGRNPTPTPIDPPAFFTVVNRDRSSPYELALSWDPLIEDSVGDPVTPTYEIFRGTTIENIASIGTTTDPFFADNTALRGQNYVYAVQAKAGLVFSNFSYAFNYPTANLDFNGLEGDGLWVWDTDIYSDTDRIQHLLTFCQDNGIAFIAYAIDADLFSEETFVEVETFLQTLHSAGLKVHLLTGDPSWIATDRAAALAMLQVFVEYQYPRRQDPGKRFDGIHLSVQPHQIWSAAPTVEELRLSYENYLGLIDECKAVIYRYDWSDAVVPPLTTDLSTFYDNPDVAIDIDHDGNGVADYPGWKALLDAPDAVIALNSSADRSDLIYTAVSNEIEHLAAQGQSVKLALDLTFVQNGNIPDGTTFSDDSYESFEQVFLNLESLTQGHAALEGYTYHDYDAYRRYLNEISVTEDDYVFLDTLRIESIETLLPNPLAGTEVNVRFNAHTNPGYDFVAIILMGDGFSVIDADLTEDESDDYPKSFAIAAANPVVGIDLKLEPGKNYTYRFYGRYQGQWTFNNAFVRGTIEVPAGATNADKLSLTVDLAEPAGSALDGDERHRRYTNGAIQLTLDDVALGSRVRIQDPNGIQTLYPIEAIETSGELWFVNRKPGQYALFLEKYVDSNWVILDSISAVDVVAYAATGAILSGGFALLDQTDWYVDPINGLDENRLGTAEQPFATLNKVFDLQSTHPGLLNDGDVIHLAPGDYGAVQRTIIIENLTIEGTLTENGWPLSRVGGFTVKASGFTLSQCEVHNGELNFEGVGNALIIDNVFTGATPRNVYLQGSSNNYFKFNQFSSADTHTVRISGFETTPGVYSSSQDNTFDECYFTHLPTEGDTVLEHFILVEWVVGHNDSISYNNTFVHCDFEETVDGAILGTGLPNAESSVILDLQPKWLTTPNNFGVPSVVFADGYFKRANRSEPYTSFTEIQSDYWVSNDYEYAITGYTPWNAPARIQFIDDEGDGLVFNQSPSDRDRDGLPDIWEQTIIDVDPNDAIASIYDVSPGDDYDDDGLSNAHEYSENLNPREPQIKAIEILTATANPRFNPYRVTLSWAPVTEDVEDQPLAEPLSYKIYRSMGEPDFSLPIFTTSETTYTDLNVERDQRYVYAVRAEHPTEGLSAPQYAYTYLKGAIDLTNFESAGDGLWVWEMFDSVTGREIDPIYQDTTKIQELISFCEQNDFGSIAYAVRLDLLNETETVQLETFISTLYNAGVSVEFLAGDAYWTTTEREAGLSLIRSFVNYQYPRRHDPHLRFDALHLDVEPHQLWNTEPSLEALRTSYESFMDMLFDLKAVIHSEDWSDAIAPAVIADIPVFYDNAEFNVNLDSDGDGIIDSSVWQVIVDNVDAVVLMSYVDDSTNFFEAIRNEREYLETLGKPFKLAFEFSPLGNGFITHESTLADDPYETFEQLSLNAESLLLDTPQLKGFQYHHYYAYRDYLDTVPNIDDDYTFLDLLKVKDSQTYAPDKLREDLVDYRLNINAHPDYEMVAILVMGAEFSNPAIDLEFEEPEFSIPFKSPHASSFNLWSNPASQGDTAAALALDLKLVPGETYRYRVFGRLNSEWTANTAFIRGTIEAPTQNGSTAMNFRLDLPANPASDLNELHRRYSNGTIALNFENVLFDNADYRVTVEYPDATVEEHPIENFHPWGSSLLANLSPGLYTLSLEKSDNVGWQVVDTVVDLTVVEGVQASAILAGTYTFPALTDRQEWHVDAVNGDDYNGDGSPAAPLQSLDRVLSLKNMSVLDEGDVIYLASGNYGSDKRVIAVENLTIEGTLDINGFPISIIGGLKLQASDFTLRHCRVHDGDLNFEGVGNALVSGNVFTGSAPRNVFLQGSSDNRFEDNYFGAAAFHTLVLRWYQPDPETYLSSNDNIFENNYFTHRLEGTDNRIEHFIYVSWAPGNSTISRSVSTEELIDTIEEISFSNKSLSHGNRFIGCDFVEHLEDRVTGKYGAPFQSAVLNDAQTYWMTEEGEYVSIGFPEFRQIFSPNALSIVFEDCHFKRSERVSAYESLEAIEGDYWVSDNYQSALTGRSTEVPSDSLPYFLINSPHDSITLTWRPRVQFLDSEDDGDTEAFQPSAQADIEPLPIAISQSAEVLEDGSMHLMLTAENVIGPVLYNIVDLPNHGTLDVSALPSVVYTPDPDYYGPDAFTFQVSDSRITTNIATVKLNVLPINDPPSFTKGADLTVLQTSFTQTFDDWASMINTGSSRESHQQLFFELSSDNSALFDEQPAIDSHTGTLTFKLNEDATGSTTITANLKDSGGVLNGGEDTSPQQSFTLTINAAPVFAFIEPDGVDDATMEQYLLTWDDTDPEEDATIDLYYDTNAEGEDGTLIFSDLSEDADGMSDQHLWDLSSLPEGEYYPYAVVDDGFNEPRVVYSAVPVSRTVNHWYIDAVNGDDLSGNGSLSAPFATLDKVFSLSGTTLKQNDVIHLQPGDYKTGMPHDITVEDLTLIGTLDPEGARLSRVGGLQILAAGFQLYDCEVRDGGLNFVGVGDATVVNNGFTGTVSENVFLQGSSNNRFEGNLFSSAYDYSVRIAGYRSDGSTYISSQDNLFSHNYFSHRSGTEPSTTSLGHFIYVNWTSGYDGSISYNNIFEHCDFEETVDDSLIGKGLPQAHSSVVNELQPKWMTTPDNFNAPSVTFEDCYFRRSNRGVPYASFAELESDYWISDDYESAITGDALSSAPPRVQFVDADGSGSAFEVQRQSALYLAENVAPTLSFIEPDGVGDAISSSYMITWNDVDPDDNATIALYYDTDNTGPDGRLIVEALEEDDPSNQYLWNAHLIVAPGDYYVYAVIDDGAHEPAVVYSPGPVTVDNTTLIDTDGDGLHDFWEIFYFENLNSDGSIDTDGDGFSNFVEYYAGTSPTEANGIEDLRVNPTLLEQAITDAGGVNGDLLIELIQKCGFYLAKEPNYELIPID